MHVIDMSGRQVFRLFVIERVGSRLLDRNVKRGEAVWRCRCDCGKERLVTGSDLRKKKVRSCGCLLVDVRYHKWLKHGLSRGGCHGNGKKREGHPLYHTWLNMRRRCFKETDPAYHNYGGRGITVCDAWRDDFLAFIAGVGPKPSPQHSIDRIDNDGPYAPGNVRWATAAQQAQNRRAPRKPAALVAEVRRLWGEMR